MEITTKIEKHLMKFIKGRKSVSYEEISKIAPEVSDTEKFQNMLELLEGQGVEIKDSTSQEDAYTLELDKDAQMELDRRKLDDPIRMYFSQMATIPLLTREEEIYLAKEMEEAQNSFRDLLFSTRFGQTKALKLFQLIKEKNLFIEQALEVTMNRKGDRQRVRAELERMTRIIRLHLKNNGKDFSTLRSLLKKDPKRKAIEDRIGKRNSWIVKTIKKYEIKSFHVIKWGEELIALIETLCNEYGRSRKVLDDPRLHNATFDSFANSWGKN